VSALKGQRVAVLVQGELAQSPRMLNHALELLAAGAEVHLIGFRTVALPSDLASDDGLIVHSIADLGARRQREQTKPAFILAAAVRSLWLAVRLGWLLVGTLPRPDAILVQNPPAVPALAIALLAARLRRTRLVVDWHNFSAAMLGLRLGTGHPLIGLLGRAEHWLARRAHAQFCVSLAMQSRLHSAGDLGAVAVLPDRPRRRLPLASEPERRAILRRVSEALGVDCGAADPQLPAILVSPTSWSRDEDMTMLLEALLAFRPVEAAIGTPSLPLVCLATGLGPARDAFEARVRGLDLPGLRIGTGWLPDDLYWDLLRAADLGLSMHRSASGVDLPMKIVDMMAADLPALAYGYGDCLHELIPLERSAGTFTSASELTARLRALLDDDPERKRLAALRKAQAALALPTWSEEWRRVALPVFADRQSSSARRSPT
jgi:beta-1,4-mannosyltransferase